MYFSYIRVSTELQEKKMTQDTQRFHIKKRLELDKIQLDREFFDVGSGKNLEERKEINKLLDVLIDNPGSTLYVYDQDRLTREPMDLFILKNYFLETKTKIIGVISEIDFESDEGELLSEFKVSLAKYERKKINRRIKHGIQEYISKEGRWGPKQKINDKRFNYYYYNIKIRNITSLSKLCGVTWPTMKTYLVKKKL